MAPVGKENQQTKTKNTFLAAFLSSSKIPVLSKHAPEWRQSQPQPCSSKARTCELTPSNPVLGLTAGLPPKTPTREPLSGMQLTTSGCRNKGDVSHGKEANSAEFVSDPEALDSILSNTGLTHQMVSVAHKPSLAQRVPLKGKTACLTSTGEEGLSLSQPHTTAMSAGKYGRVSCRATPGPKALEKLEASETPRSITPFGRCSGAEPSPYGLARRVPLANSQTLGEGFSLSQPDTTAMSAGKYGRVSCRATPGPKALEKLEASEAHGSITSFGRCSGADPSPYGLARRVPITNSQSLRRMTWTRHRIRHTACTTDKRVKMLDRVTGQMGATDSKEEDASVPWGKIAVRLFEEEVATSVKKVPAVSEINKEMGKLQRIEYLAKLLQQEMVGDIDYEEAPALKKLHKHFMVHSSPTPGASEPELSSTPPQDPKPSLCEQATDLNNVSVTPAACSIHTISSQLHICPSTSPQVATCPSSSVTSTGLAKQRLDDLRTAPLRFHEACLNDECAFYTSRLSSLAQPSAHRCEEPVAKMLNAQDTMHFTPILPSVPLSPLLEEEETPLSLKNEPCLSFGVG